MSIIIMQSIIFTHVFPTIINNFFKVITFVRANFILGWWCKQKWVWNQQKVCETYLACFTNFSLFPNSTRCSNSNKSFFKRVWYDSCYQLKSYGFPIKRQFRFWLIWPHLPFIYKFQKLIRGICMLSERFNGSFRSKFWI